MFTLFCLYIVSVRFRALYDNRSRVIQRLINGCRVITAPFISLLGAY